jgi:hypothetical protein
LIKLELRGGRAAESLSLAAEDYREAIKWTIICQCS